MIAAENTTYTSMARLAYSVDGGDSWTEIPADVIANSGSISMDFMFNADNADLYVSTFDLGLLKVNLQLESLSAPEFGANSGISIYPNPARDRVSLSISGQEINQFALYDAAGKRVIDSSHSDNVDVSGLAPGIYFVRAQTRGNELFISKLVKQ